MVFNLPNLEAIRPYSSYTDIFMLTLVWNIGIYGLIDFLVLLFLLAGKIYASPKSNKERERESLLT